MSLVDHLEELRDRLIRSVGAVALGSVLGWFLYGRVLDLLLRPYCDYLATVPERLRPPQGCGLYFMSALDPMLIKLKVVLAVGLFVALPVILWQAWRFVVPGLTKRERRMAVPFVGSSVVLFALGALVAYVTLPKGLSFLLGFAGPQFAPLLTGDRFLSFVLLVALAFVMALYAGLAWLMRTPFGRLLVAVRANEPRVPFLGFSPWVVKLAAFVLAAVVAGVDVSAWRW